MNRSTFPTVALIGLVSIGALLCGTASARPWRISIGGGGTRVFDSGLLAVTDGAWLSGADLGFAAGFDHGFFVGVRLRGMGGNSPSAGRDTRDLTASVGIFELTATGRWTTEVASWFLPFLEVEAGAAEGSLRFGRAGIEESRWAASAAGTIGVELRTPPGFLFNNDFSVGIDLAGGYAWRSRFDFDDVNGADLGALDLRGPYYRVAITAAW